MHRRNQDMEFSRLPKILISETALATATSNRSLKQRSCPKLCPIKRFAMSNGAKKKKKKGKRGQFKQFKASERKQTNIKENINYLWIGTSLGTEK